jgi:cadmium resistance protein CadD (predicted permease)
MISIGLMPKFRVKATIIDEALMKWVRPLSTLANVGLGAYILFNEVTFPSLCF